MKNAVFWEVAQCGSSKNRRFGVTCRLHLQGRKNPQTANGFLSGGSCTTIRRNIQIISHKISHHTKKTHSTQTMKDTLHVVNTMQMQLINITINIITINNI
jgi:hypothetical protein